MSEKKPRTPKIPYEIVDEDALALRFPELFHMVRTPDHSELYKKVRAAKELGIDIPGVRIGPPAPKTEPDGAGDTVDGGAPLLEITTTSGPADGLQIIPLAAPKFEPIPDPSAKPQLSLRNPTPDEEQNLPLMYRTGAEPQRKEDDLPF